MALAGLVVMWTGLGEEPIEREMWTADGQKVIVRETPQQLLGEGIFILVVSGLSFFVEQRKTAGVKQVQRIINENTPEDVVVHTDGWAGPNTQMMVKIASDPNRKG